MGEAAGRDEPLAPAPILPDTFSMVLAGKPKSIQSKSKEVYKQKIADEAGLRFAGPMLPGDLYMRILWFHKVVTTGRDGDADNICKPILDGLQGVVYRNDSQVKKRLVHKIYIGEMEDFDDLEAGRADRTSYAELLRLLEAASEHIIYLEVGRLMSHRVVFGPIDGGIG